MFVLDITIINLNGHVIRVGGTLRVSIHGTKYKVKIIFDSYDIFYAYQVIYRHTKNKTEFTLFIFRCQCSNNPHLIQRIKLSQKLSISTSSVTSSISLSFKDYLISVLPSFQSLTKLSRHAQA